MTREEPEFVIETKEPWHSDYWACATVYDPKMGWLSGFKDAIPCEPLWCPKFTGAKIFDNFRDGIAQVDRAIGFAKRLGHGATAHVYRRCKLFPEEY